MNKFIIFILIFLASGNSLSKEFKRVSYPLFGGANDGYLFFKIDYHDMGVADSNSDIANLISINKMQSKKRSVSLNKYNGAWLWGNSIILSAEYVSGEKKFSWRDSYTKKSDLIEIDEINFSQLFEISYMKILSAGLDANNSVEFKKTEGLEEVYVAYESPSSIPNYSLVDKGGVALWVLGLKKINSEIYKNENLWVASSGSGEIVDSVIRLLNRFSSSEYDFSRDSEYCAGSCNVNDIIFYKYELKNGVQKSYLISSYESLTNYISRWGKTNIIGYVKSGSYGVVYLQPEINEYKKDKNFDGKFPVVAFSFYLNGKNIKVFPGVKNNLDLMLFANENFLNSIKEKVGGK